MSFQLEFAYFDLGSVGERKFTTVHRTIVKVKFPVQLSTLSQLIADGAAMLISLLPRDAMTVSVCPSACLSVTFVYCIHYSLG